MGSVFDRDAARRRREARMALARQLERRSEPATRLADIVAVLAALLAVAVIGWFWIATTAAQGGG